MFERAITYKSKFPPHEEVTDTYWFDLEAREIAQLKATHQQDIGQYFRRIVNADNMEDLIKFYLELLSLGVAIRVGNRLDKSQSVRDEFIGTGAYNALFLELIQLPDMGASFVNEMFPQDLIEAYEAQQAENYSDPELIAMSNAEFNRIAGDKRNRDKRMTVIGLKRKELNREKNNKLAQA